MQPKRTRLASALARALGAGSTFVVAAHSALGQSALPNDPPQEPIKVLVTGSNIPGVERETASAVQVITREEIDRAGIQTAAELLNRVSAAVSLASASENLSSVAPGTPGFAAVSLRGLTYQRTLVLVNGRRVANYALTASATDLNIIPLAAVQRVEILKDGASAIYGSDALGGVVNFILREEFSGFLATAQYSAPEAGGGRIAQLNTTIGSGDLAARRFNLHATFDYQKFDALAARDRDFSSSNYIPGHFDQTSANSFPANVVVGNALASPLGDPAAGYANPTCLPPISFPTASQPNLCRFDPAYFLDAINASERYTAAASARWQWTPEHQFYANGFYARNEFTYVGAPASFQTRFQLPPTSPYYPHDFARYFNVAGRPLNAQWRSVELGGRISEPVIQQWNFVAGSRGTLGGWDYDTALSYGVNDIDDRYTSGYARISAISPLLQSGIVNPFGYNTPEVVARLAETQFNGTVQTGRSTLLTGDFKTSGAIYDLPAGPLVLAVGAEGRQWKVATTVAEVTAGGEVGGITFSPSFSASRDNFAAFAEASAPLATGLEANFAVRYDHYSDVGSTTNPKLGLRWQPSRSLLLRATVGTGFRAPGLIGLYQPPTLGTASGISDPARCPTTRTARDCNGTFPALFGGNPELETESSSQWGIGAVWSPMRSLTLGIDYFDIIADNLISALNAPILLSLCPDGVNGPTCRLVRRGPVDPQHPTLPGPIQLIAATLFNLGTVRTSGYDVDIRYQSPPLDGGRVRMELQGTYILKYLQQQADSSYLNFVDREIQAPLLGAVPKWKHALTIGWERGPWSATLTETFQRGVDDVFPEPGQTRRRRIGSYDVWHLSGSYSGFRDWQLTLGVKNLFDRDPPFTNQTFTAGGGGPSGYDPTYADPRGRTWWAAVRYRMK